MRNLPLILMSSLMILFVSYARKHPLAILALVRLLSSMSSQMHHEVALLRERAAAIGMSTFKEF